MRGRTPLRSKPRLWISIYVMIPSHNYSNNLTIKRDQIPRQPRDLLYPQDEEDTLHAFSTMADDDSLLDCFVHIPLTENVPFVLSNQDFLQAQQGDARLRLLRQRTPADFQQ
jgi:hypothetical protein